MYLMPYLFYIIFICLPVGLTAQYKFEQSRLFDEDDGFRGSEVSAIRKGPEGFLWLATDEGLCRFDGSQFYYYRHDPSDPRTIMDNRVVDVVPATDKIWVATATGLSVLDLTSGIFHHYALGATGKVEGSPASRISQVLSLFEDQGGQIWIGTAYHGLFRYLPDEDNFKPYPFSLRANHSLRAKPEDLFRVHAICASVPNDSLLYAGTSQGLLEVDRTSGLVKWYAFPEGQDGLPPDVNLFRRIYCHSDGRIYAGTKTKGIRIFDPSDNRISLYEIAGGPHDHLLETGVSRFYFKEKDEIWITNTSGLLAYNTVEQRVVFSKQNRFRDGAYYGVEYIDDRDRVWHAAPNGLQCFDPTVQQFRVHSYADLNRGTWGQARYIRKDSVRQEITIFPEDADGLFHLDLPTLSWTKTPFPGGRTGGKLALTEALGMEPDPEGNYTLSSRHGLYTFFPASRSIRPFRGPQNWEGEVFPEILWDRRGQLWVAPETGGLWCWNPQSAELMNIGTGWLHHPEITPEAPARHLKEDRNGNIWFSREGSIGVYSLAKDTICNFLLDHGPGGSFRAVNSIAEDNKGRVWFSAEENLIGYADAYLPEDGIVRKIDLSRFAGFAGFAGNTGIRGLQSDREGNIWGYTAESLIKLDASNLFITAYSCKYGKKDLAISSFHILPDQEFVFGERNAIALFRPSELKPNEELPIPYLTEIKVQNESFLPGNALEQVPVLKLRHDQNFFSIRFSAKSFTLAKDNIFQYRLFGPGNPSDWIAAEDRRYVDFSNVPSGDYLFQLQVANNEGNWNEEEMLELPVSIATPWWKNWWFRVGALLFLLSGSYLFYRNRLNQVRNTERIKADFEKKLAKVEMTALLSQMNPHFLFNCLNSIDSYIIKNQTRKASEYLNDFARLMRLILQHSRSNYVSLKDELEALELYMQMEALRFKGKFRYAIHIAEEIDVEGIDVPPMLIQPYIENAIWHGLMHKKDKEAGLVSLSLLKQESILKCIVEDNGIGRKKAMEIKARKSDTGKKSMGMAITRDRIALINQMYNMDAKVDIVDLGDNDGEATGTKVILEIPVA